MKQQRLPNFDAEQQKKDFEYNLYKLTTVNERNDSLKTIQLEDRLNDEESQLQHLLYLQNYVSQANLPLRSLQEADQVHIMSKDPV